MLYSIHVFAELQDILQSESIQLELNTDTLSVKQLKTEITKQFPQAEHLVNISFLAKNHAFASENEIVSPQDELALIPPVSGGQHVDRNTKHDIYEGEHNKEFTSHGGAFRLTYKPLQSGEVASYVIHPNHGAVIYFIGTTREYTSNKRTISLHYDAYPPMALKMMAQISDEISNKWPKTLTAIHHRLGKVNIAEISVIIAVSAPHREGCYEASRYAIERLKQIVPIWKKEQWADGSEWIGHQQGPWNPIQQ